MIHELCFVDIMVFFQTCLASLNKSTYYHGQQLTWKPLIAACFPEDPWMLTLLCWVLLSPKCLHWNTSLPSQMDDWMPQTLVPVYHQTRCTSEGALDKTGCFHGNMPFQIPTKIKTWKFHWSINLLQFLSLFLLQNFITA